MEDEERIRSIARVVIHELFEGVGVDMSTPEGRKEFRENMDWVNSFRSGANGAKNVAWGVAVTSFVSGSFWLIWQGLKAALSTAKTLVVG